MLILWVGTVLCYNNLTVFSFLKRHCTVCLQKEKTFEMAAIKKVYDSGGKGLGAWIANGLNFHMTPKSPKVIDDWVNTFVKGWKLGCAGISLPFVRDSPL